MTVGIISPAVILPPDWESWNDAELSAVPMAFGVTLDQFDREFSEYARARFGQP
jgi:hypothetical protein